MDNGLHLIAGLPRSGSTLLAAILRQNPRLHAGMSSPLGSLVAGMQRHLSGENEGAVFIDDLQREAILRGVFDGFYHAVHPGRVVFDTNRAWCTKLPLMHRLYPEARVIACVRHVPWIADSFERLIRASPLSPSRMFDWDAGGSVYSRFEALCSGNGVVGYALNALREAVYGEHADKLLLLTHHTLTHEPARAMEAVYAFIGEPAFPHDFGDITFDASGFDERLGLPGLHRIGRVVEPRPERRSVLPPDLFERLVGDSFWLDSARMPAGLKII